jgi:hypothetical protein
MAAEHWRDWRGASTLQPSRLECSYRPRHGPTVEWCGLPVTRLWRCGNRGNVASVLIEKPARGDFLPLLDGGYSLQYSPLLVYREGRGMVVFCQLDVTGRTESDPAAETLKHNLLAFVREWKPEPERVVLYAGDPAGRQHLEAAGFNPLTATDRAQTADDVLVLGPGARNASPDPAALERWLRAGGRVLAVGLDTPDLQAVLPSPPGIRRGEHIAAFFEPFPVGSPFAGVGPADVHNRDPREMPLVVEGPAVFGRGILAGSMGAPVVFCQWVPWDFDPGGAQNLKRTFRRASYVVTRVLSNLGARGSTPLLERFHRPVDADRSERRWLEGFYLDAPGEWDDPYRFFRW